MINHFFFCVCMCTCLYVWVYMHMYVHVYGGLRLTLKIILHHIYPIQ